MFIYIYIYIYITFVSDIYIYTYMGPSRCGGWGRVGLDCFVLQCSAARRARCSLVAPGWACIYIYIQNVIIITMIIINTDYRVLVT